MSARGATFTLIENSGAANGAAVIWPGGELAVSAEGTVTAAGVEMLTANGAWVDVIDLQFTAAGMKSAKVPAGQIRFAVTTGSNVYAYGTRVSGQ